MEFNKDRVYSAVNADELKAGDKVITANCMKDLKCWVKAAVPQIMATIVEIYDETVGTRFYCNKNGTNYSASLAYLVERKENCTNCGKASCGHSGVQGLEYKTCEYWKPKTEKHYRPFRDTDELIKVWGEKEKKAWGYYNWLDNKQPMPLIWVLEKRSKAKILITGFAGLLRIDDELRDLTSLFNDYTFLDGSPCGVEE